MSAHFSTMTTISALVIIAAIAVIISSFVAKVEAGGRRAIFGFGDSACDTGNNNYLATKYRADFPPYGIDFYPIRRPTGRMSNGHIFIDAISQKVGLGYIRPYLSPELNGEWLLRGASFACAGIGIFNATGVQYGNLIRMYQQFLYFEQYRRRVTAMIGEEETRELIEGSFFVFSLGGNDFLNYYNYLDDDQDNRSPSDYRSQFDGRPNEFVSLLLSEYEKILIKMYDLGGRRILVRGTGPVGCYPKVLATAATKRKKTTRDGCDEELQLVLSTFNARVSEMITRMNSAIGTNVFMNINTFSLATDLIKNPTAYGFTVSNVACCGQGPYNGVGRCTVASELCPDRRVFVFWDSAHPTQSAVDLVVDRVFYGSSDFISPMNLSTIMAVDRWT